MEEIASKGGGGQGVMSWGDDVFCRRVYRKRGREGTYWSARR